MTQTMQQLTGFQAIGWAEAHDLPLCKYADPVEDAREDLTPDEARRVAAEDSRLIYLPLTFAGWTGPDTDGYHVEDYFGADGSYLGPDERGIEPIFVVSPEHLGELTYDLPTGAHRAEPVWGRSTADVQTRIDAAREIGAVRIRWSRNQDACEQVESAGLNNLGQ